MPRRSRTAWLAGLVLLQLVLAWLGDPATVGPAARVDGLRVTRLADGRRVALSELARGRPILAIFWTTWCAYCSAELEGGVALAAELAAQATPVELLFVNVGEPARIVELDPFVPPLRDRIVLDPRGSLAAKTGVRGFPAYALVDERGRLRWIRSGLEVDVMSEVRAALADASS